MIENWTGGMSKTLGCLQLHSYHSDQKSVQVNCSLSTIVDNFSNLFNLSNLHSIFINVSDRVTISTIVSVFLWESPLILHRFGFIIGQWLRIWLSGYDRMYEASCTAARLCYRFLYRLYNI